MEGTTIDGFRLTARLGQGEDGEVFRAQAADGGDWALKLLRPEKVDHGRIEAIQRTLATLTRAAIPGVLIPRWLTQGERIALATPLLDGEDLGALQARLGRLPWSTVREIGVTIGEVLGALHRAGVVFGGLRPSKCFVDRSGRIWLRDVGLARNEATDAGASWMSPEQAAGAAAIDPRADIYALGAILHALLAGELLFAGTPVQVAMMQRFKAPRPLRKIDRAIDVPPAIESAILRALEKDPARRFAAVGDLVGVLLDASSPGEAYVPGATLAGVMREESTTVMLPLGAAELQGLERLRGGSRSGVIDDGVPTTVMIDPPGSPVGGGGAAASLAPPSITPPAVPSVAAPIDASPLLAAPRLTAQPGPPSLLTPSPHDSALPAPAGATPPPWLRYARGGLVDLRGCDEGPTTLLTAPGDGLEDSDPGEPTAVLPVYTPGAEPAREAGSTVMIPGFGGARLFELPTGSAAGSTAPPQRISRTGPNAQVPTDRTSGTDAIAPAASAGGAPARPSKPSKRRRGGPLAAIARLPTLLSRGWTLALSPLRRLYSLRSRLLNPLRGLRGHFTRLLRLFDRGAS